MEKRTTRILTVMANSPEHHQPHQFRAPPPSPIAHTSNRRSSLLNEDEISEFLEHSLHVPNLVLPDQIFPKEIQVRDLPEIDYSSLILSKTGTVTSFIESISANSCIQLVNHGVSSELIRSVSIAASGIFGLPPENKKTMSRSHERLYGFEESDSEEESETSEEFVWCRDEGLKSAMEGIKLQGFSNFSKEMENLSTEIEKIAYRVLSTLSKHAPMDLSKTRNMSDKQEIHSLVCYLHKHHRYTAVSKCDGSLKSDFIRMLIRGSSDYSHALCVHICDGLSEFHVYSKKGWISFKPNRDAIVMTIGDQIQAWSNGDYRNVTGRPIFEVEDEEPISMAFLYSPTMRQGCSGNSSEKTISLRQQLMFALLLTIVYNIFVYLRKMF